MPELGFTPGQMTVDPKTGKPLAPRDQPGYYPGFNTLSQQKYWDQTTRDLVHKRVNEIKPIRFFTPHEAVTMEAIVNRILPQEDRIPERRIPILPGIDERLYTNRLEGYRFEDMPPDQDAYRVAVLAFDQMGQALHGKLFHELEITEQESILKSVHGAEPLAAEELWKQMNIERFWTLLVSDCCSVYYAHPWAWDEVGFGGPAYPRGYMRLEEGEAEPWEVEERRYEWDAPSDTLSGAEEQHGSGAEHQTQQGQGGNALSLFDNKSPLFGAFGKPKEDLHYLGPLQKIKPPQRVFRDSDLIDYAIVGVGSAGGVLLQRLARAGFKVVGFEAGPFWDTERDWVSDEAGSHKLYWNDLRITGGEHPLALGANNSGRGVGGGSVHWAAFTPRFHPSDFEVYTRDGVGADWPISYEEIEPYYELLEQEIPVAGPAWYPWGKPHGHPYAPHPVGGVGNALIKGCTKLGIPVSAGGPVAILTASHGDRPHCIYRGFCIQGCKVGAKASTLVTHVPNALEHGAEVRDNSMVSRVSLDKNGRTDGVFYFDTEGNEHFQRARAVIVCGYALETPRLLFNSACPGHERGLANSSGTLGKYLMAQAGNVILGRFEELVRMYKAPPAHALTEEFYETDPKRGFARGFAVQTVGPLPIAFAKQMMAAKGLWGWGLRRNMMDYNHWCPLGLLGEILPWEDNRIELADGKEGRPDARDRFGLPVAKVTFSIKDNDKKLIEFGKNKVMEIMHAAGAVEIVQESRYAHLVGACRMSATPEAGVCDKFGRTWDVPNLFVMDGSVMPTQGSANPGLTIQALAARTADYLVSQNDTVFTSSKRDMTEPPCRKTLSPPGTFTKGAPHLG